MFVRLRACSSGPGTVHTIIPCCSFGVSYVLYINMSVCFSVLLIMVCFLCECGSHVARRSPRIPVLVAIALPLLLTPLFCSYQMRTTGLFVFSFCFVFSQFLCLCMGGLHLRIGWVIVPTNIAECCLPYLLLFLYHISNLTRLSLCVCCVNTAFCVYFWYFYY